MSIRSTSTLPFPFTGARPARPGQRAVLPALALSVLLMGGILRHHATNQVSPDHIAAGGQQVRPAHAVKWTYDEMTQKLVMEQTDLAPDRIKDGFSNGIGRALIKVTRQSDGRPVILNFI